MEKRRKEASPTVTAFNELNSTYSTSYCPKGEVTAKKLLSDGTQINIRKYSLKLNGSKSDAFHVEINNHQEKISFSLQEKGLLDICINGEKIEFRKHLQSSGNMRIKYNDRPEDDKLKLQVLFRKTSKPLVDWIGQMVKNQKYSSPPISIVPR
jgi:hypothetical protein